MPNGDKPIVNCSVSNCNYWGEHNVCSADQIMIEIDQHATARFKEEFAAESYDTEHHDTAPNSAATCCLTFKPKKS